MGKWIITIEGSGPHHNGKPEDADKIFNEFVGELVTRGGGVQALERATFTYGSREVQSHFTKPRTG